MKKSFLIVRVFAVLISCIVACTTALDEKDIVNVGFDVKVNSEKFGFVDEFLTTKLAIVSENEKLDSKYVFKYEVLEGQGKLVDENKKEIPQSKEISLDKSSLDIEYVSSKAGINVIKFTVSSNFEIEKEITIKFEIKELDIIWNATSEVTDVEIGEKVPVNIVLKNNSSADKLLFQSKYTFTKGKGKLLDAAGKDIVQEKLAAIKEGEYVINVLAENLGEVEVEFELNYNENKTIIKTIAFNVEKVPLKKDALITEFKINNVEGKIVGNSISIELPENTVLTSLTPVITISDKATIDPLSGKALNFSSPVKYTVTAEDGVTKSEYTVTATVKTIAVEKIVLSEDKELLVGGTHTLVATITPDNATNKTITWSSSKPAIASVDAAGKVTTKAAGTTIITATTEDGGFKATATITVKLPPSTEAKLFNFKIGTAVGVFTGNTINISIPSTGSGVSALSPTFEISPKASVNVQSGMPRDFNTPQTYIVTAEDGVTKTTYTVNVRIKVTGVGISFPMGPITLEVGQQQGLTTKVFPLDATNSSVTYKSDNTAIAIVNSSGDVTAIAPGEARITVTTVDGGLTDSIDVNVKPAVVRVTGVSISSNVKTILVGQTTNLAFTVSPPNATNKSVTWRSNNGSAISVEPNGRITGIKSGKATITVTTADGSKMDSIIIEAISLIEDPDCPLKPCPIAK